MIKITFIDIEHHRRLFNKILDSKSKPKQEIKCDIISHNADIIMSGKCLVCNSTVENGTV